MKLDSEAISEFFQIPFMRLAGPVTGKICGGDIGDGLWIDTDDLRAG
jgi:hypothetical protein